MKAEKTTEYIADMADGLLAMTDEQRRFIDRQLWYTGVKTTDPRLTPRAHSILIRFHSLAHNVFKHEAAELIDFLLDIAVVGAR